MLKSVLFILYPCTVPVNDILETIIPICSENAVKYQPTISAMEQQDAER